MVKKYRTLYRTLDNMPSVCVSGRGGGECGEAGQLTARCALAGENAALKDRPFLASLGSDTLSLLLVPSICLTL